MKNQQLEEMVALDDSGYQSAHVRLGGKPDATRELAEEVASLKAQLMVRQRSIDTLLVQIGDLSKQKERLEEVLRGVESSKSWRLTAPLRRSIALKKRIFPLLRFGRRKAELVPEYNIQHSAGRFRVFGSGPRIALELSEKRELSGWHRLSAYLNSDASHIFFYLYYDTGKGFNGQDRLQLPFESGKVNSHLIRLPEGVRNLRFEPFSSEGSFELKDCVIRELGKLQVCGDVLRTRVYPMLLNPARLARRTRKAFSLWRSGGIDALRARLFADDLSNNYEEWVRKYDTLTDQDRRAIRSHIERLEYKPRISVVMPTYNTPERWLRLAIESVLKQLYQDWELCIADDASTEPHVRPVLEEYAARDGRIKVTFRDSNGHISRASNSALALAEGEFVALLDHDDELTEHALYMVACELNRDRGLAMIFSDEDKITSYGMRFNPFFKSSWNPDLLLSQNCVCHLGAYRTDIVRSLGGFRETVEGAQDWDLALRVADSVGEKRIAHIPHILYHWRVIEGSTAQSTAFKPYVLKAQALTVSEHLARRGVKGAEVLIQHDIAQLRVNFPLPAKQPLVSIIIPTRDQLGFLRRCVESIQERSTYRNFEFVIIDNNSGDPATLEYFETLEKRPNVRVVHDSNPFNYSRLNNMAVREARGELLAFLNNDLEVITPEWLSEMVSHAVRPEVGAVGARLWYPNNLLQHGGVILGIGGVAGHNHKGRPKHDPGYFNRAILTQNLSAVTAACMLMRREVFEEIGGFDEVSLSVAFNDVDLCLKARERGYKNVYTPYAELYHYESASRGYENTPEKFARFEREIENMKRRWADVLCADPYYNPNLSLLSEDFVFAFPPRAVKPWRSSAKSN